MIFADSRPQNAPKNAPNGRVGLHTTHRYLRPSQQDTKSQEPDLKRWVDAFADLPVKFYRDKASGKTMDRPAWNRLEADLEAGKVAAIVVWRLDRLGRTASGLTALFERLIARRINLVSVRDSLDLSTAAGRLMANVLASVARATGLSRPTIYSVLEGL